MKKIRVLLMFFVLFFILFSASLSKSYNPASYNPSATQVFFYEHINYGGAWMSFEYNYDVPDLTRWFVTGTSRNWNDIISSIKVGPKVMVTVYEHINYQGKSYTFKSDCKNIRYIPDLRTFGWNDKISSFKVYLNPSCK